MVNTPKIKWGVSLLRSRKIRCKTTTPRTQTSFIKVLPEPYLCISEGHRHSPAWAAALACDWLSEPILIKVTPLASRASARPNATVTAITPSSTTQSLGNLRLDRGTTRRGVSQREMLLKLIENLTYPGIHESNGLVASAKAAIVPQSATRPSLMAAAKSSKVMVWISVVSRSPEEGSATNRAFWALNTWARPRP